MYIISIYSFLRSFMPYQFIELNPNILNNPKIREPQIESYKSIINYFNKQPVQEREVGIILPVGCGKSGVISLIPFALKSKKTLVIAPNLNIADQLYQNFVYSHDNIFYKKCEILKDNFPEPAEIRSDKSNLSDLEEADIVITNIQQLQGSDNKWLEKLDQNFFDLIIFDEAHHNVAETWNNLKQHFPDAKIVNLSATPKRADGQMMAGNIIYTYSIKKAIDKGYVKNLTATQLDPQSLKYVRNDGKEIEVPLEEVIRLGEEDVDFKKSIVTSEKSLNTIVDASIQKLKELREITQEKNLKIIASALNYAHCKQITAAYRAKGYTADYIHSKEDSKHNKRVLKNLNNHDLDVIVQVRKLGEGFDHPYLSVAAIFSVFTNLSPFVQFVGRIMRVIEQNKPNSPLNQGVVVYHAGSNIIGRWSDFQNFSTEDQKYIQNTFLITEHVTISSKDNADKSINNDFIDRIEITNQSSVMVTNINLIDDGLSKNAINQFNKLEQKEVIEIKATRQSTRQAQRKLLDDQIKTQTGHILSTLSEKSEAYTLDKNYVHNNYAFIKSLIDNQVNQLLSIKSNMRHEIGADKIKLALENMDNIVQEILNKLINIKNEINY